MTPNEQQLIDLIPPGVRHYAAMLLREIVVDAKMRFTGVKPMKNEAFDLLVQAARACRAWHDAEEKYLGTFNERCELCNYSEWLTRKALAAVDGVPFTEAYEGVPYLIVADQNGINPRIVRASESDAAELAVRVLEEVK